MYLLLKWLRYLKSPFLVKKSLFLKTLKNSKRRIILFIIIIIIMFLKGLACFLFLDPQNEVGPYISSSVALYSIVLLVYIVMLVLVFYLCPSSVRVGATFSGTVLFPLLYSVLPFFSLIHR